MGAGRCENIVQPANNNNNNNNKNNNNKTKYSRHNTTWKKAKILLQITHTFQHIL